MRSRPCKPRLKIFKAATSGGEMASQAETGSEAAVKRLMTSTAEGIALQVDILDRVGEIHDTAIVSAVNETEAVSEFVDRLFFASKVEHLGIFRQSVEFLPKPVDRNDGSRIIELGFAENEREGRDEEVHVRDSQQFYLVARVVREQPLEQFGGIILLSHDIIRAFE
jgi:hypothetical protein